MRAVLQRVSSASVTVEGQQIASIERGLMILLGIKKGDTEKEAKYLAEKCAGLRIFSDKEGRINLSARDVGGEMLVVSNFTLYGDSKRGKRPSFTEAAGSAEAAPLYERFIKELEEHGFSPQTGQFGADMSVALVNDGPITIFMDTEDMM